MQRYGNLICLIDAAGTLEGYFEMLTKYLRGIAAPSNIEN